MEASVECTHCRVVMTSWSAPGSPIRYYQCPFCQRTHSSLYGEVFRRRAGARLVDAPARPAASAGIPMATPDDVRWARVKATAARWFARLDADEQRFATDTVRPLRAVKMPAVRMPAARTPAANRRTASARAEEVPEIDPRHVVELAPARRKA